MSRSSCNSNRNILQFIVSNDNNENIGVTFGDKNCDGTLDPIVSANHFHTCGIKTDGSVQCWGAGTTTDNCYPGYFGFYECGQSSPPSGLFMDISAGNQHTCGIKIDGTVQCWGVGTSDDNCNNWECGQSSPP